MAEGSPEPQDRRTTSVVARVSRRAPAPPPPREVSSHCETARSPNSYAATWTVVSGGLTCCAIEMLSKPVTARPCGTLMSASRSAESRPIAM